MRRTSAILILVTMLANGVGFYVYYAIHLRQIKTEMRKALHRLPESELEVLKLTHAEYMASRVEEHEVRVKEKMYDVARICFKGDSVLLYGIHDKKEDNLLAWLDHLVGQPLKDKHAIPFSVVHFLTLTYLLPANDLHLPEIDKCKISPVHYFFSFKIAWASIELPPPKA